MAHELLDLPYDYDALEPYIDEQTMRVHHGKHHQAYVNKLNAALEGKADLQTKSVNELLQDLDALPDDVRNRIKNAGGGHANHTFFWSIMKKDVAATGAIAEAINAKFGSMDAFKEEFSKAAAGVFGSGWAWLVVSEGELEIMTTANQDSPLSVGKTPLLCLDVWEHAYYLQFNWQRPKYIEAWWNVINWEQVNKNFEQTK